MHNEKKGIKTKNASFVTWNSLFIPDVLTDERPLCSLQAYKIECCINVQPSVSQECSVNGLILPNLKGSSIRSSNSTINTLFDY